VALEVHALPGGVRRDEDADGVLVVDYNRFGFLELPFPREGVESYGKTGFIPINTAKVRVKDTFHRELTLLRDIDELSVVADEEIPGRCWMPTSGSSKRRSSLSNRRTGIDCSPSPPRAPSGF